MEVLFHLVFIIIKVAILSCLYGLLFLLIIRLIKKRLNLSSIKTWMILSASSFVLLFVFMNTYWGNHGLGDGPKIPIGNGIIVDNINWTEYGYIKGLKTNDNIDIEMTQFKVIDDKLIGNLNSSFYDFENSFFVYDLDTKKLIEFKTKNEFDDYLVKNELGTSSDLLTFRENYNNHWNGWRFWLLA